MRNLSFVKRMMALAMALAFLLALNATRVEAAQANNLTPEQIEAIVTAMFKVRCVRCSRDHRHVCPRRHD
jgi:hypothetical protein